MTLAPVAGAGLLGGWRGRQLRGDRAGRGSRPGGAAATRTPRASPRAPAARTARSPAAAAPPRRGDQLPRPCNRGSPRHPPACRPAHPAPEPAHGVSAPQSRRPLVRDGGRGRVGGGGLGGAPVEIAEQEDLLDGGDVRKGVLCLRLLARPVQEPLHPPPRVLPARNLISALCGPFCLL